MKWQPVELHGHDPRPQEERMLQSTSHVCRDEGEEDNSMSVTTHT